jgi:hypothetical protein
VQLLKNFPICYGIECTSSCSHEPSTILSQDNPVHTMSHLRFILILSFHLHLGILSGRFPSGSPTNILYVFPASVFVLHALPISPSLTLTFWGGGGTAFTVSEATTGLLYQPRMMMDECGAFSGMLDRRNRITRRKPAPLSLCPQQIPHYLNWARTWAVEVGNRQLTA